MSQTIAVEPSSALRPEPSSYPARVGSVADNPLQQHAVGWLRPTPASTSLDEMRRRYREDGYLYVKGALPREDVLDMRADYFRYMADTGLLKPGTSFREGIYNPDIESTSFCGIGSGELPKDSSAAQKVVDAHTMPEYLKFMEHPDLRAWVCRLMGWKKEVRLLRTLLRYSVPGAPTTGVHYDKIFLRDSDSEFLTAWIPLGDISNDGGGLVYLENSRSVGQATEADFSAKAAAANFTHAQRIFAYNANMMERGTLSDDLDGYHRSVTGAGAGAGAGARADADADSATGGGGGGGGKRSLLRHRWLISDYEAGDVVFHEPFVVHAASMNLSAEGRIRLSTDLRFCEEGQRLDERWMQVWNPTDRL